MTVVPLRRAAPGPVDRGELLRAEEVSDRFLKGAMSADWVYRNVPHKITVSRRLVLWYEADVQAWLETLRGA